MKAFAEHLFWMTVCIYHEGRGEPLEGQKAIAHTIMNRVYRRKISVEEVVLERYQYSWANGGARPPIKEYSAFLTSLGVAFEVLEERMSGETFQGVDHYFADRIPMPSWAKGMKLAKKIGKHTFYRS